METLRGLMSVPLACEQHRAQCTLVSREGEAGITRARREVVAVGFIFVIPRHPTPGIGCPGRP